MTPPQTTDTRKLRYAGALASLEGSQKTSRGVSLYSRSVNRPLGRRVAAAAHVLGMQPDHVTWVNGVCTAIAVVLLSLAEASPGVGVAVAALLVMGFVLDSADGQLARLTHGGSARGELLDHLLDCTGKLTVHAAVLIAFYRLDRADGVRLLIPLAFQIFAVLLFFEGTLVGKLREHENPPTRRERPASAQLAGFGLLPVDHGIVCLSFVVWGFHEAFLVVYGLLLLAHALAFAVLTQRWFRELASQA